MGEAGIDAAQLARPGYRLPLFKAFRLLLAAEQHCADPLMTLRLAAAVRPRSFQVLGYAAMSCSTLSEAIARLLTRGYHAALLPRPVHLEFVA